MNKSRISLVMAEVTVEAVEVILTSPIFSLQPRRNYRDIHQQKPKVTAVMVEVTASLEVLEVTTEEVIAEQKSKHHQNNPVNNSNIRISATTSKNPSFPLFRRLKKSRHLKK